MQRALFLFLLMLFAAMPLLQSQPVYRVEYPYTKSPYAGAQFHLLLHHELSELENKFIPGNIFNGDGLLPKSGNMLYRAMRMGTIGFYMTYLPIVNQHEYFGHLARAKQYNAGFTRYEIYLFPPSGGRSFFGAWEYPPLQTAEQASLYAGGVEANMILAEDVRSNSLIAGSMTFQDAMLYIGSRTDFSTYVLLENNGSYDDITQFLSVFNTSLSRDEALTRNDLKVPALLSIILDPFTLSSIGRLMKDYLIDGHSSFETPSLFKIGNTKFVPFYSFVPAADGLRHSLNCCLLSRDHLLGISIYKNAFTIHPSAGLQIMLNGLSVHRSAQSFDLDLRYWNADPIDYHNNSGILLTAKQNGFLLGCTFYQKILNIREINRTLSLFGSLAYKSPGYTQGYPLAGGLKASAGLGLMVNKIMTGNSK